MTLPEPGSHRGAFGDSPVTSCPAVRVLSWPCQSLHPPTPLRLPQRGHCLGRAGGGFYMKKRDFVTTTGPLCAGAPRSAAWGGCGAGDVKAWGSSEGAFEHPSKPRLCPGAGSVPAWHGAAAGFGAVLVGHGVLAVPGGGGGMSPRVSPADGSSFAAGHRVQVGIIPEPVPGGAQVGAGGTGVGLGSLCQGLGAWPWDIVPLWIP